MSADLIIITRVRSQKPPQMRLAQDDEVVNTLATDRSDQSFSEGILPRRGRRDRLVSYAHSAQATPDDGAKDAIPVTNEITRRLAPGERFVDLTRNPFRCRMPGDVDSDEGSAVEPDNDEGAEQIEADGRNDG